MIETTVKESLSKPTLMVPEECGYESNAPRGAIVSLLHKKQESEPSEGMKANIYKIIFIFIQNKINTFTAFTPSPE